MKWVESKQGGGGGPQWVDRHVHTFVNIAGPLLGVIKSATSYISGEMHDTAELGPLEGVLFGTSESAALYRLNRRRLFRTYVPAACCAAVLLPHRDADRGGVLPSCTAVVCIPSHPPPQHYPHRWGSLTAMLPKGGSAVWGNLTHAPDDPDLPLAATQELPSASIGEEGGTCLPVLEDGAFVAPPEAAADGRTVEGQEARGRVPRSFAGTAEGEKAAEAAEAEAAVEEGRCVTPGERRAEPVRYGQLIGFSSEGGGPAPRKNWTVEDVSSFAPGCLRGWGRNGMICPRITRCSSLDGVGGLFPHHTSTHPSTAALAGDGTPADGPDGPPLTAATHRGLRLWMCVLRERDSRPGLAAPMGVCIRSSNHCPRLFTHLHTDVADPRRLSTRAQEDRKLWTNPLSVALPKAPNMRVLCFYGVGKVRRCIDARVGLVWHSGLSSSSSEVMADPGRVASRAKLELERGDD